MTVRRTIVALVLLMLACLDVFLWIRVSSRNRNTPIASDEINAAASLHQVVIVGGGLLAATAPAGPEGSYAHVAARQLNWRVAVDAQPSTGYWTPKVHPPNPLAFSRVVSQVSALTRVLILADPNDDAATDVPAATERAAANGLIAAARAQSPALRVIVVGPVPLPRLPTDGLEQVRLGLRQAAADSGATFLDPVAERWLTNAVSETVQPDLLHLTPAGHAAIGARLGRDLAVLNISEEVPPSG